MVSMHSNSFFITTTNSRRQQWSLFVLLMFLGCGVESNSRLLSTSFQSDASEKTCWRSNGASIQDCRSISGIDQNSCNTACDAENFEYAIFYPYDSRCYCKCSNTSPHSLDMSVACVDNDWCTCTDKTVVPAGCVGDEGQNLDRCEDGFEVGVYFPCYNTRYPATQLSGHFSNGWQTSEGCAFECNERDDCEMYSFQFRDERADKVGHCVLFSHSAMTSGDIVEWGNPGSLKCVKKERIDTIPDLKFYLKVDDYTSGNAWVDRVSNVEVHVPGSASFHEGYVHLSGSAITAPLQTNPNYMQSVTYVIRLRVPTIPSNLGWVMSQFGDYGWSRALTISDYRLGNVGQTPGNFESGLGSFPTDSWQVLVGTWTQHGACQTFLQGTSGNPRICSNGRGTDSNEKLIIGGRMETDGNHNPQSVDISDVLVFNRVLNTDEINFITSTLSQPKPCGDGDVLLEEIDGHAFPHMYYEGAFYPVIANFLWNNQYGYDRICKNLGYSSGSIGSQCQTLPKKSDGSNGDGIFLGECEEGVTDLLSDSCKANGFETPGIRHMPNKSWCAIACSGTSQIAPKSCATPNSTPQPSVDPSRAPSKTPSKDPTPLPTPQPSVDPTRAPSKSPSKAPTVDPTPFPTPQPSVDPTRGPSKSPSKAPTVDPTPFPTPQPSVDPTRAPSKSPSKAPTVDPTPLPTPQPSVDPTRAPSKSPSKAPTFDPTPLPTPPPSVDPTRAPSKSPSKAPTVDPTPLPTPQPSVDPTRAPSKSPSKAPTVDPTRFPTPQPSVDPTRAPSKSPSKAPTFDPTPLPTPQPSANPTKAPSKSPSKGPTVDPTKAPSQSPTNNPSSSPSTSSPSTSPTAGDFIIKVQGFAGDPQDFIDWEMANREQPRMNAYQFDYVRQLKRTHQTVATKNPTQRPTSSEPTPIPTPQPTVDPTKAAPSQNYIPTDSTQIHIVVDEDEMNCPCTGRYRKLSVHNPRPYYRCMGAEDGCDVKFGCVIYWNDDHWRFASGTTICKTYSNNQNTPNVPTSGWNNAVKSISN